MLIENGFDSDQNCTLIYPAGMCHWYVFMATELCILMHFYIRSMKTKAEICSVTERNRLMERIHNIDCQYLGNHAMSRCLGCHFFAQKYIWMLAQLWNPLCFVVAWQINCLYQINENSVGMFTTKQTLKASTDKKLVFAFHKALL